LKLAFVARFKVGRGVGIYAWPVVTLQQALLQFVDAIMTDKQIAMSVCKGVWDERCW